MVLSPHGGEAPSANARGSMMKKRTETKATKVGSEAKSKSESDNQATQTQESSSANQPADGADEPLMEQTHASLALSGAGLCGHRLWNTHPEQDAHYAGARARIVR